MRPCVLRTSKPFVRAALPLLVIATGLAGGCAQTRPNVSGEARLASATQSPQAVAALLPIDTGLLPPQPLDALHTLSPLPEGWQPSLSARAVFDQGWQAAERAGGFDSLFFNTCDELLEGGRSSVFIKVDGHWMTPPLSADILPGVMRAVVLEEGDALIDGPVQEATVTRDMVQRAEAIVIANALRGTLRARLI